MEPVSALSPSYVPYDGMKYPSFLSSHSTFLCGIVVSMCREGEGGVQVKYVSHRLGEVAVVLEEEGQCVRAFI